MTSLAGAKVLVVGASSGIGRQIGLQAGAAGASVAFLARRRAQLDDAVAATPGTGHIAVACDVRDEAQCVDAVAAAADALGGLDHLVYATAIDVLIRLADAGPDTWSDTFATNVFGAASITRAALPRLKAAKGRAVYLSASSVPRPLPGMGVYAASKAALETMVTSWQHEHPDLAFTTVRIGSVLGTGVTDSWSHELLGELAAEWGTGGYLHANGPGGALTVEQAAAAVLAVLTNPAWLREVTAVSDPGRENYRFE
ncbi:SDR family oxidoreductase [[Mycobacterium] kokjensenii]|uniref:SDR family oxidoreductase n=1 Tax=[Mycobacterium] kokjensenii TaxID=3064287 RepID=A0ABN9NGX3_9MYCO|nr:SDR family oxidoreductase [Mycolicibacter sp. MU0083]CAJ1506148.1 SDR family oxidoreductase [Mycolicibacter sp. MU0083]